MAQSPLDGFLNAYSETFPYHRENLGLLRVYAAFVREIIERRKARSVLSLGLGDGVVAHSLAPLIPDRLDSYLIVEGSPALIERFENDQPGFAGEIAASLFESFETGRRFDLVEMGFVLEHVEDPQSLLLRFLGLLNPGGGVAVAVPNALSLHRRLGHAAGFLPDPYALSSHDRAAGHVRSFDHSSLAALVEGCGFQILNCVGLMMKPFSTAQLERLKLPPEVWDAMYEGARDYPDIANAIALEAEPHAAVSDT